MIYLHIIAEGNSEEEFVSDVLSPHLAHFNVFVSCQKVHTGGNRIHPVKGGLGKVPKYRPIVRALERWVESDRSRHNVYYSTMLDLYAFPKDSESPFNEQIQRISDKYLMIEALEKAMYNIHQIERFIPYVQLHEFETLVLADPEKLLLMYPDREREIDQLKNDIKNTNIELINDSPQKAPSKRIIKVIPEYEGQKATVGPMVVQDIGIQKLRSECIHFNAWITRLEKLGDASK